MTWGWIDFLKLAKAGYYFNMLRNHQLKLVANKSKQWYFTIKLLNPIKAPGNKSKLRDSQLKLWPRGRSWFGW
jgi:hypothetical protein